MRSFALFCILFLSLTAMAQNPTDLRTFGEPSQSNIYLFTSPSCPHCRDFHKTIFPELIKRYINTKRAQLFIVHMMKMRYMPQCCCAVCHRINPKK